MGTAGSYLYRPAYGEYGEVLYNLLDASLVAANAELTACNVHRLDTTRDDHTQYSLANGSRAYSGTLSATDIITKGPWVDVRSFMDGLSGRPTYATWYANQATTDVGLSIQAAYNSITTGTIKFPSGFYLSSLPLTPKSGITIEGDGIGATSIKYIGTGYFLSYTALTSINHFNMGGFSLYLGTNGTGLIQIGNTTDSYNDNYWRNDFHWQDLYLYGDYSSGDYRTGTIGILTKQIGSSQFDNVHIHNFESTWIWDTHSECQVNKYDENTYRYGLDIRGQTFGQDKSTFVQPCFHGPRGASTNGWTLKVNAGGITMINALYEPNGVMTGSGNKIIWLGYYGINFTDIRGDISVGDADISAFPTFLTVDQMGGGYIFDGLQYSGSIAGPGVSIAAPDVNPGSIGRFIACSPQIRTIIRNTSGNIGRYAWIGPGGSGNYYYIDGLSQMSDSLGIGKSPYMKLDVNGGVNAGSFAANNNNSLDPTSGPLARSFVSGGNAYFQGIDGDGVTYVPVYIDGYSIYFKQQSVTHFQMIDGDLKWTLSGKGIILNNAAGTVTKRVRLNDTGDGLIYETP